MQLQPINVVVYPDSPITFSTQVNNGFGQLSEKINGVSGVDLYLIQLIAEYQNG